MNLTVSSAGIALIKEFEGFEAEAYLDIGGVATIGYGTTYINNKPVQMGMTCTEEQATGWLTTAAERIANSLNLLVLKPLTQSQFDALVDFCYNLGVTNFKLSTLLRYINVGEFKAAQAQILIWNHDHGKVIPDLTRRRLTEAVMFGPVDRQTLINTYNLQV